MKKQFKLPKEFGEKWLQALRSGEYKQGGAALKFEILKEEIIDEDTLPGCYYCCLGVAGKINGASEELLENELVLTADFSSVIPMELIGDSDKNELVRVLTGINDGISKYTYNENFTEVDYVFRHGNIHDHDFSKLGDFKLDFNQIADFIEDNCEFYETNVNQEL